MATGIFTAASQGAMDDIRGTNATPAPVPTPEAVPQPVEPAVSAQEATPPVEPTPSTPVEEMEEIIWQGKPVQIHKSELKTLAQKGFDYTQKTQVLAETKRELETQLQQERARYAQEREEIITFMKDPAKVQQYAQALAAQAGLPTESDEVITAAQMQKALQQQAAAMHQQMVVEIEKAKAGTQVDVEQMRVQREFESTVEQTIGQLTGQHKILADFYDPDDLVVALKGDALKQLQVKTAADPDYAPTPADIRKLLTDAAARRVAKAEASLSNHNKMAAVRAAKLTTTGIEPAGGAPVAAAPPKPMKLGSAELRAAVLADLEAASRTGK